MLHEGDVERPRGEQRGAGDGDGLEGYGHGDPILHQHALANAAPRYNRAPDATRRPRPAPPAPARPTRAATPPRPGSRGDAASRVDRPDRPPLPPRAGAGARRSTRPVRTEASPAPGMAPDADETRAAGAASRRAGCGHFRRAALRFVADAVGESARGWRWLAIKIGISVWLRELFTLAVARDLYAGVPAIYVNYLDYDVFAHAYGPRHRRALRALRRIDRSISRLWRVLRRVPGHRYDLYVLSDHGQVACTPYERFSGGKPIEQALFDDLLDPLAVHAEHTSAGRARRVVHGLAAYRTHRASGFFQRFVNYLERDFPWVLGGMRSVREHNGIRVVSAGPNAFVYFLERAAPVRIEWIDERFPGLADQIARSRGVGFVLARAADGPVCCWRGKRYRLDELGLGPFGGRDDLPRIVEGLRDLMAMESAGDLVVYGIGAPEGNVSFVPEVGAHGGPSYDELHTFVIHPPHETLASPIAHPTELYAHFMRSREAA